MRNNKLSMGSSIVFSILALTLTTLISSTHATAQAETVLKSFSGLNGNAPEAGLIFDAAGNLYGTTSSGGKYNFGMVFELIPNGSGGWTERSLHSFASNGKDGTYPSSGLVFDQAGNLYGVTSQGGTYAGGTVFELMPHAGGLWSEKVLHSFNTSGGDGVQPSGNLVFDAAGNLYGTTYAGGKVSMGTVFELSPAGQTWREKIIHRFNGGEGERPAGGVILDAAGNLYGTATQGGGELEDGTVFKLTPGAGGSWAVSVLSDFDGSQGAHPGGGLVFGPAGNLYGTTSGGDSGYGNVFELTPTPSGPWTVTVLLEFSGGTTGGYPNGLIFDPAGNLYGATYTGGANGEGLVFELSPATGGGWTESILYSFYSLTGGVDGFNPVAGVVLDAAGHLYGTTEKGGTNDEGTVFEVTP